MHLALGEGNGRDREDDTLEMEASVANRTVKDSDDRIWTCVPAANSIAARGRDVILQCTTPTVEKPVTLTVSWQWEKMNERGLARLIVAAMEEARRAA